MTKFSKRFPLPRLSETQLAWGLILAVGAALRLYNLGAQSQWYDEMLVSVHAAHSLSYLTDLSWRVEIHPPLYYWFNHLLQSIWANDAFLRLPSALAGLASIPLIGLVAARLGQGSPSARFMATAAMALASVNPLHIWISRQVRPYAIIQLFCCLGFLLLLKLLEKSSRATVARLVACNIPIIALHYLGVIIMISQGVCLAVARLLRLGVTPVRDITLFAVGSVVTSLPALAFLVSVKWLHTQSYASAFLDAAGTMDFASSKIIFQLLQFLNFGYFDGKVLWLLPVAALALGLAFLWRINPGRALTCLLMLTTGPALLLAIRYTGHFTPVHLSYALPIVFSCLAAALAAVLPQKLRGTPAALLLLAILGAAFVIRDGHAFYHPDAIVADSWDGFQERPKRIARLLAANTTSCSFVIIDDNFAASAVDWYLRAQTPQRSLDDFAVTPDEKQLDLIFLSKMHEGHTPAASFRFLRDAPLPPPLAGPTGNMRLYMALVPRTGYIDWSPTSPLASTRGMLPHRLLGVVSSLSHVRIFAEDDFQLCPARVGTPGEIVFHFVSPEPFAQRDVYLLIDGQVHRAGNRLDVEARFDDGPFTPLASIAGEDVRGPFFLRAKAPAPFRVMDVRLRLSVPQARASRIDGPLEQVRVSAVTAYVPPAANRFHGEGLDVDEQGLAPPTPDETGGLMRWGYDATTLSFSLDQPRSVTLHYTVDSPLAGQHGAVAINGAPLADIDLSQGSRAGELTLPAVAGKNQVTLSWALANTGPQAFAPNDKRPLAVRYKALFLDTAP